MLDMKADYAILMDGGFVRVKVGQKCGRFPMVEDILYEVKKIKAHKLLVGKSLLRVYYYDAPPASGMMKNPIDGTVLDLTKHPTYARNQSLQQGLEMQADFALRVGELSVSGWTLGRTALHRIKQNGPRVLTARDMVPKIEQKGVDLRIGLDIARLSLRGIVSAIVVVTGDSDIIPAFKFARREGVRVYLDHMGHGVKRDLKAHTDAIL